MQPNTLDETHCRFEREGTMNTAQEFEREWAQVKGELSKLKGQTVYTIAERRPNEILNADDQDGLEVQRGLVDKKGQRVPREKLPEPKWISWEDIGHRYRMLWLEGELKPEQNSDNPRIGSSCKAILCRLTTAKKVKEGLKTFLRYVPEGRPPLLKE